ncbi:MULTISPECIES: restriction endonuclease subunit S [Aeromonas]|uniref:restriction endonuclease subunit S n=1 Tax=Aeromonas TaxID=642 RepID=UPI0004635B62|nr:MULTISPECIES: restriction endonuclease subunit S [Aeromonas]BEE10409.1 type I restriction enzyme specificity protein [Aeromonas dhakensis]HDX8361537.1 restriction endonuclease subunit S [Aeromonas veronii]AUZ82281.1 restriction endonuclease subunit S [Aeromonas sp. ASNIH1]MBP4069042.1 restriction endonuclease subunit S [Aeromonas sp. MaB10011B]MBP4082237.1 restriction endonuclease subunit S [Aeromonas sp. MrichA-1]
MAEQMMQETAGKAIPAGYKQTEVGVIPEDWSFYRLGDLEPYITSGSRGWAKFYSKHGDVFVRITNMSRESIYLDLKDICYVMIDAASSEGKRTSLEEGDVLVSITADIGICSYIDSSLDKPAFINQHIALIRFNHAKINSKFIAYYLSSHQIQKLFKGSTDQGAKAGMNLDAVRMIKTALPTLQEQTAIANVLSDSDALIDALEQLIAKKQAIKSATMQQLLTGRTRLPAFALRPDGTPKGYKPSELGEIPEDWEVVSLGDASQFINGRAYALHEWESSGVPVIRLQNLTGRGDEYYYSNLQLPERQYCDFGDLLFMWSATFGPVIWKGSKAIYHYHIWKIECKSGNNKAFLFYLLGDMTERLKNSSSSGGTMLHVTKEKMESTKSIFPSIEEQTAIATILSDMDNELQALTQKLEKARALKQGMMQQLLTGKIRLPLAVGA